MKAVRLYADEEVPKKETGTEIVLKFILERNGRWRKGYRQIYDEKLIAQ